MAAFAPLAVIRYAWHHQLMKRRTTLILVGALIVLCAIGTLPVWGMGAAVFLDSERTTILRKASPDGRRIAQVDRLVVGGVPSIVVTVRSWWTPNWYLTGCALASHYEEADALVSWVANDTIMVTHTDDQRFWDPRYAPFHPSPCNGLKVTFKNKAS